MLQAAEVKQYNPVLDFDWVTQDYTAICLERARRLTQIRKEGPEFLGALKEFYKTNPVAFITDWGMTVDPRNAEVGKETTMPFILFKRQQEFIEWIYSRWRSREDGLAEKSRDMGVSWLCVAFAVWMWLFHPDTVVGFGSRKEEYVDKIGDPKSLFWKARAFINLLPIEFRPNGYEEKRHAPSMRILNPENNAAIVGEAGDNIGRGNRTAVYFKDESAFYERAQAIDAALSQTSNCKIDVSTPNGNGNAFFHKRFAGKIPVFTFRWQDDPRKGQAWYARQRDILDPVILAQEVDVDYAASVSNAWIPADLVAEAQKIGPAQISPVGQWIVGVDAAHEGNDKSVLHFRRGRLNLPQITEAKLDGVDLARLVENKCDDIIMRNSGEIAGIIIELDGPGVSCYDQLKRGRYADRTYGIHTGKKLADGRHLNLRALLWAKAKKYLEEPPVSMPPDGELRSQIGSMKYFYKDGMLQIQDKKTYKKEYGRSPDNADAFVLSFYDDIEPVAAQRYGGHTSHYNPLGRDHLAKDAMNGYNPLSGRR